MIPLWEEHYKETASKNYGALDPDLTIYDALAAQGLLRVFTAREDLLLVGYQVFFVTHHPHHKDQIQAEQDILYLSRAQRVGLNGYQFLKFCIDELRREGVHVICQRISARNDFGRLLERLGFELEDLVYSRRL